MTAPLLTVEGLSVRFGGLMAVDSLDLAVAPGTVHALIGPNGAGKTTAFNLITGLIPPTAGRVRLGEVSLDGRPSWARSRAGLARTFQNIRMFGSMTVLENVMTGAHGRIHNGLVATLTRLPSFGRAERATRSQALALLNRVGLAAAAHRRAGDLSYGDQRRVEIARALAAGPKLLLLDEPAAGMNPTETEALGDLILSLKAQGLTMLLVEHDMHFVMKLSDQVTVLNFGRKIAEGAPAEVRADPQVVEAYLGAKVAASLAAGAAL